MSGKEVLVTTKVEESHVVSEIQQDISDDEIQLVESKPTDIQKDAPALDRWSILSDAERIQQEVAAATSVQAAFRGYLVIFSPILDSRLAFGNIS